MYNMATMAEDKLKTTTYTTEQRRWDFEKFVNLHKAQHSIMEGLVEHGYTGIDPRSKVRYLLDGIKTDKLDSVKTRIISDATLRNDFDACVTLYQDFIKQTFKSKPTSTVNISQVKTNAGKRKSVAVEDRYYTKAEYAALSADEKKELASKRLKRGHKPGAKDSTVAKPKKAKGKTNADVIKNLKAVQRTVSQLTLAHKADDDDNSGRSTAPSDWEGNSPTKVKKYGQPTGNRAHLAITRQLKKQKEKEESK